ncbi:unnamed protein product [Dibothriocephalus latus]|uniref:Uncharacterized protein n=1 Tax=Dibothriocephalus latus TaxID=60516 RepID=A0A3P7LZI2_DIBLA|nr:unnamed protein product [Dibothriocephalus latus]
MRPQQTQEASFPESSFSQTDLKPLSCHLADLPFNVELQMPAQALVHTPLLLKYTLENKTSFLQVSEIPAIPFPDPETGVWQQISSIWWCPHTLLIAYRPVIACKILGQTCL